MRSLFRALAITIATMFCLSGCQNNTKAKYIFLFIADGMGASHISVAESYLSYKEGKLGGEQLTMTQFPCYGMATTYGAIKNVSCSAAAGTAIACGEKVLGGTIGISKDSVNLKSIAYELKEEGYKIGILTTSPVNHATPAAFYAHNAKRINYHEISSEIPESGFDLFAGSGFLQFNGKNNDKESTEAILERNGYTVSYGMEEFRKESIGKDKVIFCQAKNRGKSAGYYVSDGLEETSTDLGKENISSGQAGNNTIERDANLEDMVKLALDHFGDEKPFFIMGEGGVIDWASHENRTMSTIEHVLDFDAAIKAAYEFYKKHPKQTLIVVTSDHETGGLSLGCGRATINWKKLEDQWIDRGKRNILDTEANSELNKSCSIGWATIKHTGCDVPVYAIGVGAEAFCGKMDNTEFKDKILGNR